MRTFNIEHERAGNEEDSSFSSSGGQSTDEGREWLLPAEEVGHEAAEGINPPPTGALLT